MRTNRGVSIRVGESFSSYEELDAKIRSYQKDKFVQLRYLKKRLIRDGKETSSKACGRGQPCYYLLIMLVFMGEPSDMYMHRHSFLL